MTKVYIALVILGAVIAFGFVEYRTAINTAEIMENAISAADEAAREDSGDLEEKCRAVAEKWDSRKPLLQLFLPHESLDLTTQAAQAAALCGELDDSDGARTALSELSCRIDSIRDSEQITIFNIM